MQTRTITVDYARPRGYDVGYRAENNFTELSLPVPAELEGADSYRVYFESTVGEYLQTELLTPADGYVTVKITSDIVPEPGNMAAQLVAFRAGEIVGYAPMITGTAKVSIPDGTERLSHSLAAEIALNTAARHTHSNKDTLDKLSVSDGKLQYDGSDVGLKGDKGDTGATGADGKTPVKGVDYWTAADKQEIIDDIHPAYYIDLAGTYPNYTCPVAMDDIKAAYNAGYNLVCRCTLGVYTATLPLFIPVPTANTWIFSGSGALESMNFSAQSFTVAITANGVAAQNSLLTNKQLNINVSGTTYHYDGSEEIAVAVKAPVRLITTTDVSETAWLTDNTEYRLADITTLTLNYPPDEFECWMRLSFAASGTITVTLPAETKYIGTAPDFKNGETWELSFKDKVLAAQKVGDGT